MQALINWLVQNVMKFWPIARIYSWHSGLRVRCGIAKEELRPGLHWRWPFIDEVFTERANEYPVDLPTGCITTSDGRTVAVSAVITLRITSIRMMWLSVSELNKTAGAIALGFLTSACAEREWAALTSGRDALQRELAEYMTRELAGWGVEVPRVLLTHLVQPKPWLLMGDGLIPRPQA